MNGIIMNVFFSFLLLAHLSPSTDSITVSPDIRYRNSSIVSLRRKVDVNHINLAALTNDHGNPAGIGSDANGIVIETDRQRRLIPYMTFYMPSHEYHNPSISQAYAYNMPLKLHPIQQSQAQQQTNGQPIKQQLILVQPQHQHQQQQQHHTSIYRPREQPHKYQRPSISQLTPIAYNTRQQATNYKPYSAPTTAPKPKIVYETKPVVYKITATDYESQQQPQQVHYQEDVYHKYKPHQPGGVFTPFLPSNQLPGPFVPMSNHYSPPKFETTVVEDDRQEPDKSRIYHQPEQSYHQTYVKLAPTHKYKNHNYNAPPQYETVTQQAATPEPVKNYYQYENYNPETYANTKHVILQQEKHYATVHQPHHVADVEDAIPQYVKYEKPLPAKPKPDYHVKQIYLRPVEAPSAITHRAPATQLTLHKGKYGGFKPNYSTTQAPTTQHTTAEAYEDIEYYPKLAQKPIYYPVSTTATPYRPKFVMKTQLRPTTSGTRYATPKPTTIEYHRRPQTAPAAKLPPAVDYEQDFKDRSLADILKKLQDSNTLPHTLTPDNIDNSIRTLVKILNNLKQTQTIHHVPPQKHQHIDYDAGDEYYDTDDDTSGQLGPNSGKPGIDYPALAEIPKTRFSCKEQRYKGFFGDPETHCQVWHYCDLNGGQASFLCPNGTIFSQVALTCDWWFNVKCSSTAQLYVLNERLYKYILPFQPKFPEDYSGPLVDKYLALKFKEMEEKMQREKSKNKSPPPSTTTSSEEDVEVVEPASSAEATSAEAEQLHYSTTEMSRAPPLPPPHTPLAHGDSIETEKLEVIEINAAGTSGHLTPHHGYGA